MPDTPKRPYCEWCGTTCKGGCIVDDVEQRISQQPIHARILLSDDGNGYDATECATCREVIGPWPQHPHHIADCVRSLAKRLEATNAQ